LPDNPSWYRLRQFRPAGNLLRGHGDRQGEFSMPSYTGSGVIKGGFVNALRRGHAEIASRSPEGFAA